MAFLYLTLCGFLFLWSEIAVYFRMDANAAFLMTAVVFAWHYVVHAWAGELLGQSQFVTASLFEHGLSWIALFFWLSPPLLASVPFTIDIVGWVVLAFAGAHARLAFERRGHVLDKQFFREHSEFVVGAALLLCVAAFISKRECGTVLPLAGHILLIGLPLRFGWVVIFDPTVRTQFNAAFGSQSMFEDSDMSEEI